MPQPLINRGTSLLLDFIGIANGYRNLEEVIPTDINASIEDVVRAWRSDPHQDNSIIDYADDYEKYLAALVLRIGHEPAADRSALSFAPLENLPFIRIAAGRFFDTLLNFLEWLNRADPPSLNIATGLDRNHPFITIAPRGGDGLSPTPHEEKKINSFIRRFRLCGLILNPEKEGFRLTLVEDQVKENDER